MLNLVPCVQACKNRQRKEQAHRQKPLSFVTARPHPNADSLSLVTRPQIHVAKITWRRCSSRLRELLLPPHLHASSQVSVFQVHGRYQLGACSSSDDENVQRRCGDARVKTHSLEDSPSAFFTGVRQPSEASMVCTPGQPRSRSNRSDCDLL